MSNNNTIKFKTKQINGKTIYSFDYLMNTELTDDDLSNLFDKDALLYSIIFNMFYHAKINIKDKDIYNVICSKKYYNKYNWKNTYQKHTFEDLLTKVIQNIYQYNKTTALSLSQWYMIVYGLGLEGNKIDL